MNSTIRKMLKIWKGSTSRDTSEVAAAIVQMTADPIEVADRIAEAGQRDPSLMPQTDAMDEINSLAAASTTPETEE